jgi:hypothetical protein
MVRKRNMPMILSPVQVVGRAALKRWARFRVGLNMPVLDPGYRDVAGVHVPAWKCHVCGHTRPDDRITTFTRTYDLLSGHPDPAGELVVSVRHCIDRPRCRLNAPGRADRWTQPLRDSARNRRAAARVIRG